MTNDAVRAVVITGKYVVRASPREKRNIEPCLERASIDYWVAHHTHDSRCPNQRHQINDHPILATRPYMDILSKTP